MHRLMLEYLKALRREGHYGKATSYELGLQTMFQWALTRTKRSTSDPTEMSTCDLESFQKFLAKSYRSPNGKKLAKSTQTTRLCAVKDFFRWLHQRGHVPGDPAAELKLPRIKRKTVAKDFLTQQEAAAMLDVQAKKVSSLKKKSNRWARALRDLALLSVALATGRRRTSLTELKVRDLDFKRSEIRIEWEKKKPGRVLPIAKWAMGVTKRYLKEARPVLLDGRVDEGWLWPASTIPRITKDHLRQLVMKVQKAAVAQNPDLEELAQKKLGTHGLRVTYAKFLFDSGADLRSVNELLLHAKLSTTARYVPLETSDIRRALRRSHPRA